MGIVSDFYKVDNELADLLHLAFIESQESEDGQPSEETQAILKERAEKKEEFITKLGSWYLSLSARHEGRKAEYKPVIEQIKDDLGTFEKELEFILFCLRSVLRPNGESKVINSTVDIRYRKSEQVQIDNEDLIPVEFSKLVTQPDKVAIKQALKTGKAVTGAKLIENWNPQIKAGGDAAIRRAVKREKEKEQ
jgi:hypothetical protein